MALKNLDDDEVQEIKCKPLGVAKNLDDPEPKKKPKKPRKRHPKDDIWDAIVDYFGDPKTEVAAGLWGKVQRELFNAGARPEQIRQFAQWWEETYPYAEMSIHCYPKHWPAFIKAQENKVQEDADVSSRFLNSSTLIHMMKDKGQKVS